MVSSAICVWLCGCFDLMRFLLVVVLGCWLLVMVAVVFCV